MLPNQAISDDEWPTLTPAERDMPERPNVLVIDHPLAKSLLSILRDARTENPSFRAALRELTTMLIYEASRDLSTYEAAIQTPVAPTLAVRLSNPPLLVPILRAGLGMAEPAQALMPQSQMGFVGLARDEATLQRDPVHGIAAARPCRQARLRIGPDAGDRRIDGADDQIAGREGSNRHHRNLRASRSRGPGRAGKIGRAGPRGHCVDRRETERFRVHRPRSRRRGGSPVRRRIVRGPGQPSRSST